MVGEIVRKKKSLFRETWKAINAAKRVLLPTSVIFSIVGFMLDKCLDTNLELQTKLLQTRHLAQHQPLLESEYTHQLIQQILIYIPLLVITLSIQHYIVIITYLRFTAEQPIPTFSIKGFFYWFRKVAWQNIRPLGWVLIPFIGIFFYFRSTEIGYVLVSPLAALKRGSELTTSWQLTNNNKWRILWSKIGVFLSMAALIWGIEIIPIFMSSLLKSDNLYIHKVISDICQAAWFSAASIVDVTFSCTAYRVLLQEKKQPVQRPQAESIPQNNQGQK